MKQEREGLELELELLFQRMKSKGKIKDANSIFTTYLKDYINEARIIQFVNRNLPLSIASVSELYHLTRVAKMNYQINITLEDYFTDTEMTNAIENKAETFYKGDVITFEDVIYNNNELNPEWTLYLTYEQLAQLSNNGYTSYNMQTQRGGKFYKVGNELVVIASIYPDKIKAIKNDILTNKFKSNTITLNAIKNNKEIKGLIYNQTNKTLTIDTKIMGKLAIIDGAHRTFACSDAYLENPNIKGNFVVTIKNLTIQQAKDFIVQESKANSQSEEDIELYDNTNAYTIFIKDLDTYGNEDVNVFFNKISITNDKEDYIIHDKLIKEILVASDWKTIVQSKDIKEVDKALNFIVKFFTTTNKLMTYSIDYFKDESFIMGLFISAYKMYSEIGFVDMDRIEKMIKQIEKIGLMNLSFDIPIKPRQEKKIISVYEGIIKEIG